MGHTTRFPLWWSPVPMPSAAMGHVAPFLLQGPGSSHSLQLWATWHLSLCPAPGPHTLYSCGPRGTFPSVLPQVFTLSAAVDHVTLPSVVVPGPHAVTVLVVWPQQQAVSMTNGHPDD